MTYVINNLLSDSANIPQFREITLVKGDLKLKPGNTDIFPRSSQKVPPPRAPRPAPRGPSPDPSPKSLYSKNKLYT